MAENQNAIVPAQEYRVAKADPTELQAIIRENVGPEGISEFDLDRVRVPAGGATVWEVPALDGTDALKELVGVVVFKKNVRAYWSTPYEASGGGGQPPDCYSDDGLFGEGDPGGACAECPLAKFGTAENGRAQACRAMQLLFLARPHSLLPLVVVAPPTSLRNLRKFFLRLANEGRPYWSVVVGLGLQKAQNANGVPYSVIVPRVVSVLDEATTAKFAQIKESLAPALSRVRVERADVAAGEE